MGRSKGLGYGQTIVTLGIFLWLFWGQALMGQNGVLDVVVQAGLASEKELTFNPILGSGSILLAVHLNDFILVAPEFQVLLPDLKPNQAVFLPGVTANYQFGSLFFGAGVLRWFDSMEREEKPSFWATKIHAGYQRNNFFVSLFSLFADKKHLSQTVLGMMFGVVL